MDSRPARGRGRDPSLADLVLGYASNLREGIRGLIGANQGQHSESLVRCSVYADQRRSEQMRTAGGRAGIDRQEAGLPEDVEARGVSGKPVILDHGVIEGTRVPEPGGRVVNTVDLVGRYRLIEAAGIESVQVSTGVIVIVSPHIQRMVHRLVDHVGGQPVRAGDRRSGDMVGGGGG